MDDDDAPPGVPEWVVTYGDMMSLLLTFFIMLVSMSEIKEKSKYREVLASLHDRLGYAQSARGAPGDQPSGNAAEAPRTDAGVPAVTDPGAGGSPRPTSPGPRPLLTREPPGRPVSAGAPIPFAPGGDEPAAGADRVLDSLAAAIAGKPQTIELRGFAAPPAPSDPAADGLAYRRTRVVLDELTRRGVRPGRFRLRTGGLTADPLDEANPAFHRAPPAADRVEVWVLDRLAADPRAGA